MPPSGAAFLLVQLRELRRDILGDGAGRHLDAVAVRVIGEFVAGGDIYLRAGAGNVARHDGLHDAVLDARVFAQASGGIGDLDGSAVGCDTSSSHSFVLLFFVQNLFIIGVFLAGDLLNETAFSDAGLRAEAEGHAKRIVRAVEVGVSGVVGIAEAPGVSATRRALPQLYALPFWFFTLLLPDILYNFTALVQIVGFVWLWCAAKCAACIGEHPVQRIMSYVLNVFDKRDSIRGGIVIALRFR